ncbi:MAG: hypothetical protein ACLUKN_13635 [Bacilli bacterium]
MRKLAACAAFGFCLSACSYAIDSSAVLQSYVDNTVVATYSKMSDSAIEFNAAASELKKSPSDENAEKAAKKWSQVRTYWEQESLSSSDQQLLQTWTPTWTRGHWTNLN